jgi:hypothetical protein
MRVERQASRRGNAGVVISTLLSLAVVGAAVAVVAWLVLRAPSTAVDSAERLDPIGTAIVAPTAPPSLPTPIPTLEPEPEPTALGFTGEGQPANALPTVAAPVAPAVVEQVREAGPTPTPRLIALATAVPTAPAPVATLPPAPALPPAPVAEVPVVALAPIDTAPAPAPADAVPLDAEDTSDPEEEARDDDPFNIFTEGEIPRIVPSGNDALARVQEMQEENRDRAGNDNDNDEPAVAPTFVLVEEGNRNRDDPADEELMPDVEATVEANMERAFGSDRNRSADDRDNDNRRESARNPGNRRKNDRNRNRRTAVPDIVSSEDEQDEDERGNRDNRANTNNDEEDCPFANLPEDKRPKDWPFGEC